MKSRSAIALASFGTLCLGVACLDTTSPVTGIGAITTVIAAIPSVSVGEDSQDTLGQVQRLRVYVFAPNGDTVRDARVVILAVDTTKKLRIDSLTGIAHGDSLSPNAAVVARVTPASGKGSLQTFVVPFPVVPVPHSATKASDTLFSFSAPPTGDTLASSLISPPLGVTVHGEGAETVPKYLVSFELVRSPPSRNDQPTMVIVDDAGKEGSVDTTDASGHASRRLRIRLSAVQFTLLEDTAIVRVHVKHGGKGLPVTPVDSFVIPVKLKL
jgi:hypothetical protein